MVTKKIVCASPNTKMRSSLAANWRAARKQSKGHVSRSFAVPVALQIASLMFAIHVSSAALVKGTQTNLFGNCRAKSVPMVLLPTAKTPLLQTNPLSSVHNLPRERTRVLQDLRDLSMEATAVSWIQLPTVFAQTALHSRVHLVRMPAAGIPCTKS